MPLAQAENVLLNWDEDALLPTCQLSDFGSATNDSYHRERRTSLPVPARCTGADGIVCRWRLRNSRLYPARSLHSLANDRRSPLTRPRKRHVGSRPDFAFALLLLVAFRRGEGGRRYEET